MKRIKTQKGITLIALIITIVVLLILAVVAIGTAQESNIVGYAQNAAGSYNQGKVNEVDTLTKYENTIEEHLQTSLDIKYYIENTESFYVYKLDYTNGVIYSYYVQDNVYIKDLEEPLSFFIGDPIAEDIEIEIWPLYTTEILPKGAMPVYLDENKTMLAAYLSNDKLYTLNWSDNTTYIKSFLVSDESKIAEIEDGIASIK